MTDDRVFWSGELCFGIVNIPFSLGITRKSHDHVFKQYVKREDDYHPVGRLMIDKETGLEVKQSEVVRGIDIPGSGLVYINKSELDALTPDSNHSIQIESFFELDKFDFNRFDTTYHVIPDQANETGLKAFTLLYMEMYVQNKGAFVRIKMRHREQLCLLHANGDGIVCSTLYYENEIIKQPELKKPELSTPEINAAMALVNQMTVEDHEYSNEQDTYWHAVSDLIVSKAQ